MVRQRNIKNGLPFPNSEGPGSSEHLTLEADGIDSAIGVVSDSTAEVDDEAVTSDASSHELIKSTFSSGSV